MTPAALTVSVVQNSACPEVARNLDRIERLVSEAPRSDLIALPEVFAVRGGNEDYRAAAETIAYTASSAGDGTRPGTGPIMKWLHTLARRLGSWILAGSLIERHGDKLFNTSALIDRQGALAATYRKIHLFEARLDDGKTVREREVYEPGAEPVMATIEGWRCGMAICYDLRFPELFRLYAGRGAHLFFVSANFTQNTGTAHWETLLRARAIENQAFVVAPDQCGRNTRTGIESYGHSLIAGPWGEMLCKSGNGEGVIAATLDPAEIARTRERIPALAHRRL